MAKGQKRSNREVRKPKQIKASPKTEILLGNKDKFAVNASNQNGKHKN